MALVRLVLTIETNQQGEVSLKSLGIEPLGGQEPAPTGPAQPIASWEGIVSAFLSKISYSETRVLRMLVEARRNGTQVYLKDVLSALKFDRQNQWNGPGAWLTRHWRAVTGNPNAHIIASRYDQSRNDYEITFAAGISDEVVAWLAEGLRVEM